MQINPYLLFDGQCEAAFKFYEQCLGGKIEAMLTYAGSPAEKSVPAEWRDKVLHAKMDIHGMALMGSDAPPGRYERAGGVQVTVEVADPAEAERLFHVMAEGAQITMPVQATFWATRFAMFVDRFGIPWMINCPLEGS